MLKRILSLLCIISSMSIAAQTTLKSGSIVPISFTERVTSASTYANIVVAQDIKVNGVTIIAAGTPVLNQVTGTKKRGCGRPGTVTVVPISTTAVNGEVGRLMGQPFNKEGVNRKGMAIGLGVGLGVFCWPCLACLAIKGRNAEIPIGTIVQNMMTNNEVTIK